MSKPQQSRHQQGRPRPRPRPAKRPEHPVMSVDHSAEGSTISTPTHRSPPKTSHTAMIEPQAVTQTRFRDVPRVSEEMLNAIPFEFCTEVRQSRSPPPFLVDLTGSSGYPANHTGRQRFAGAGQDWDGQDAGLSRPFDATAVLDTPSVLPNVHTRTLSDPRARLADRRGSYESAQRHGGEVRGSLRGGRHED